MVIAIDPDVQKSGVYIRFDDGKEDYKALTIVELRDYFCNVMFKHAKVVIECSYLVKRSNFHRKRGNIAVNERIARMAGRNEGACLQIIEFAKEFYHEKDIYLIEPFSKAPFKIRGSWTEKSRAMFKNTFTPKVKKLNDDMRDARLIYEKMKNKL